MWNRVKVNAYEIVLVFYMDELEQVLTKGKYWLRLNRSVHRYDVIYPANLGEYRDILIEDELLTPYIDVVDVKDNEIAIQYRVDNFVQVLPPGRYIYWKDGPEYTYDVIDLNDIDVSDDISTKVLMQKGLSPYLRMATVEPYERAVLFVDSVQERILQPGLYKYWKGSKNITVTKVDMRKQAMELSGQEVLTKDKAAVRINFYASYQVVDLEKAVRENQDYTKQLYLWIQIALREYTSSLTLDQILADKSGINNYVLAKIKSQAPEIGLEVSDAGVKDIILPGDVKDIMNQVLIAEKRAQAQVIMRREETASTRSLLNTAKLMENNAMLYKLKEMEYVEKISDNIQNITLSGGGQLVDQLKTIFSAGE